MSKDIYTPEPVPATNQAGEVDRPRMTGEEWEALPENARRYIMMLETDADPSGTIRSEMILRDYVELLEARINETNGCFDAAVAEGLYERLQEVEPDEQAYASLVDLVQRRLMYAYTPAPKRPLMRPDRHPGWTEAGHQWLDAGCPDRHAIADLHRLQHGEIPPLAKSIGGGPILRWAVDEIKALHAALATQPATSQEGNWVLVPRELTDDMHEAVVKLDFTSTHDPLWPEYWAAMLDAAPKSEPVPATNQAGEVAKLREALDWAISEIEGRTRYNSDSSGEDQYNAALDKAKLALASVEGAEQ